ncbi:hypothetical protein DVH24_005072 [Malus domestica]|uniref:FBD domain-containing protein n=1 Tax=Malus domestica TaxID=3750 RepID=A0A498IBL6_MALDO|nr:hypothetical protein DVH24_005072 [Malus domestica]
MQGVGDACLTKELLTESIENEKASKIFISFALHAAVPEHLIPPQLHTIQALDQLVALDSKCDYNSRKRKENKYDYNLADRISELTDELLVSLLTLLPLKEAAATSILSKRWHYVWRYVLASTRTLNFDAGKTLCSLIDLNRDKREQKICKYVDWVNSVVEQHIWPNVEQFRVAFDLDDRFSNSINKWIQFALKKRAQVLELDFSEDGVYRRRKSCYNFPHELLGIERGSASTALYCDILSLNPCVYLGFKSLKVLHFSYVDVGQEVLEYFLSNCPVLERLSVFHAPNLLNLRVVGPSIALKCLDIERCGNIESVEICNANLVSFNYVGNEFHLLVRNVPRLSQSYKRDQVFPILANLKHLELILGEDDASALLQLTCFMRASPCLHRLVLYLKKEYATSKRREIIYKKAPKCFHNHLKVLELVGYVGHTICGRSEMRFKKASKCSSRYPKLVEIVEYDGCASDFEIVNFLIECC